MKKKHIFKTILLILMIAIILGFSTIIINEIVLNNSLWFERIFLILILILALILSDILTKNNSNHSLIKDFLFVLVYSILIGQFKQSAHPDSEVITLLDAVSFDIKFHGILIIGLIVSLIKYLFQRFGIKKNTIANN